MSPNVDDLKNQIKMAEQQKKDAQKRIAEEKKLLKQEMRQLDKEIAEERREKSRASADLAKLP
jgi:hypothetical protein